MGVCFETECHENLRSIYGSESGKPIRLVIVELATASQPATGAAAEKECMLQFLGLTLLYCILSGGDHNWVKVVRILILFCLHVQIPQI